MRCQWMLTPGRRCAFESTRGTPLGHLCFEHIRAAGFDRTPVAELVAEKMDAPAKACAIGAVAQIDLRPDPCWRCYTGEHGRQHSGACVKVGLPPGAYPKLVNLE